jgi:hypothetical protein
MDARKLADVMQRIARLRAPSGDALDVSRRAIQPLADLAAAPSAVAGGQDASQPALDQALVQLRNLIADTVNRTTREYYENVLSAVARLKG